MIKIGILDIKKIEAVIKRPYWKWGKERIKISGIALSVFRIETGEEFDADKARIKKIKNISLTQKQILKKIEDIPLIHEQTYIFCYCYVYLTLNKKNNKV